MAEQTTTAPITTYTDNEATDEAVLMLTRRLRRLHRDAYAAVLRSLSEGAQTALGQAEIRADRVRDADVAAGIKLCSRPYPDPYAYDETDEDTDDDV